MSDIAIFPHRLRIAGLALALTIPGCSGGQQPAESGGSTTLVDVCVEANATDGCNDTDEVPVGCAWYTPCFNDGEGACVAASELVQARIDCEEIVVECASSGEYPGQFIEPLMCEENGYGSDGATAGGWSPGSYVYYDTGTGVYMIDSTLFDELVADPRRIIWDCARVDPATPYYRLTDVASGDLVDLLGLQDGDKFISVNSYILKYDLDVMVAFEENAAATEFELKIYNWSLGGMRTQYYELY